MKISKFKFILGFICGALIFGSIGAFANSSIQDIAAKINYNLPIFLNGKKLELENGAINYKDVNYLSIRETAEALQLDVFWNPETKNIELTSKPEGEKTTLNSNTTNNNGTNEKDDKKVNTTDHKPDSRIPKYGFEDVVQYQGKDYITINEIMSKVKGIYILFNAEADVNYLSDKEFEGNVLIEAIPYKQFELIRRIDYEYYTNEILPLSK